MVGLLLKSIFFLDLEFVGSYPFGKFIQFGINSINKIDWIIMRKKDIRVIRKEYKESI